MLKLKDEFSELFDVFNQDEDVKFEKFKDTLEETVKFSEKLKDTFLNGTEEEKQELQEFLEDMQSKIENEKNKLFQKMGISEEELKAFVTNKDNFSETEWNAMQEMKNYLQEVIDPSEKEPKRVKKHRSKTKWIQS